MTLLVAAAVVIGIVIAWVLTGYAITVLLNILVVKKYINDEWRVERDDISLVLAFGPLSFVIMLWIYLYDRTFFIKKLGRAWDKTMYFAVDILKEKNK